MILTLCTKLTNNQILTHSMDRLLNVDEDRCRVDVGERGVWWRHKQFLNPRGRWTQDPTLIGPRDLRKCESISDKQLYYSYMQTNKNCLINVWEVLASVTLNLTVAKHWSDQSCRPTYLLFKVLVSTDICIL